MTDSSVEAVARVPSGYTPETWAAKQAEVAEFSRRNPYDDPPDERKANSEARLNAAMCIQCADVPDQFALVRRGDLINVMHDLIRSRAGFEIWQKERAERASALPSPEREPMREALEAEVVDAARLFLKEGTRVTQRGDGYFFQQVIEKKDKSDPHYRLCVAVEKLDALAPPTAQSGDRT